MQTPSPTTSLFRDDRQNEVKWIARFSIEELISIPWSIRPVRWGIVTLLGGIIAGLACLTSYALLGPLAAAIICGISALALFVAPLMNTIAGYFIEIGRCQRDYQIEIERCERDNPPTTAEPGG